MGEFATQVHKLDDRTYYLDQFDVHCYLFLGTEKALLVDTGFQCFPDLRRLAGQVTGLPLVVVNTHGHPDHVGGNLLFDEIYAHPDGFEAIRTYQGGEGNLKPLQEGDVIDIGGRAFEVLLTPGHQEGHIALLNRAERTLLPGDVVQPDHIVMYLPGADVPEYRKSLLRLQELGGAYDTILPCHGEVPMGKELFQPILACVDAYLAGRLTAEDDTGPDGTACKAYRLGDFRIML